MPRQTSDREAIEAEIDRVRPLGLDELRTLWRTTFRSSPPSAFTKDLMARFFGLRSGAEPRASSEAAKVSPAPKNKRCLT
jgi:hypothetical protein